MAKYPQSWRRQLYEGLKRIGVQNPQKYAYPRGLSIGRSPGGGRATGLRGQVVALEKQLARKDVRTALLAALAYAAYRLYQENAAMPATGFDMTGWTPDTVCQNVGGSIIQETIPSNVCYVLQARDVNATWPLHPVTSVHEWRGYPVPGSYRWDTVRTFTRAVDDGTQPFALWTSDDLDFNPWLMPSLNPALNRPGMVIAAPPQAVPYWAVPYLPRKSDTIEGRSSGYDLPAPYPATGIEAFPDARYIPFPGRSPVEVLPLPVSPVAGGRALEVTEDGVRVIAETHAAATAPPGTREIKFTVGALPGAGVYLGVVNFVTEFSDLVNALYNALPRDLRLKPHFYRDPISGKWRTQIVSPTQKLEVVYNNWKDLDGLKALRNVVVNEAGDRLYGTAGKLKGELLRKTGVPTGYPFNHLQGS